MKKTIFVTILCLCAIFLGIKFSGLDHNKKFLEVISRSEFDEVYYVSHYPEVTKLNIDPFVHYSTLGWKEGKNPRADFNTKFYINMNFSNNKYDLNPLQHYVRSKLQFHNLYTNPSQLKLVTKLDHPKYYIALVAIFQNEARFLREWIESHLQNS